MESCLEGMDFDSVKIVRVFALFDTVPEIFFRLLADPSNNHKMMLVFSISYYSSPADVSSLYINITSSLQSRIEAGELTNFIKV